MCFSPRNIASEAREDGAPATPSPPVRRGGNPSAAVNEDRPLVVVADKPVFISSPRLFAPSDLAGLVSEVLRR